MIFFCSSFSLFVFADITFLLLTSTHNGWPCIWDIECIEAHKAIPIPRNAKQNNIFYLKEWQLFKRIYQFIAYRFIKTRFEWWPMAELAHWKMFVMVWWLLSSYFFYFFFNNSFNSIEYLIKIKSTEKSCVLFLLWNITSHQNRCVF